MATAWPVHLSEALDVEIALISSKTVEEQKTHFSNVGNVIALFVHAVHPPPVVLFAVPWRSQYAVDREGDLLVGFAALDGDVCEFEVSIGGHKHESLRVDAMTRGSWRVALGGRFPIPLLNLRFHEVRLHAQTTIENCWVIYAYFESSEFRNKLCRSAALAQLSESSTWVFTSGMGRHMTTDGISELDREIIRLPEIRVADLEMARATERTDILREELMRAAWRPDRMRRWCLEHDDDFFDDSVKKVTVIDGFFSPEECQDILLAASHRELGLYDSGRDVELSLAAVERKLVSVLTSWSLAGRRVQLGDTARGTHMHADMPLQGGDATLLVYLNSLDGDGSGGGDTCFPEQKVRPLEGRAVLFGTRLLHMGEPCSTTAMHKWIVAFELHRTSKP